jgi:hypothetical protein
MTNATSLRGSIAIVIAIASSSCATQAALSAEVDASSSLARARAAYVRASVGPTGAVLPDEMTRARDALEAAAAAYRLDPRSEDAADLAYIAELRAELAESHTGLVLAERRRAEARRELDAAGASP